VSAEDGVGLPAGQGGDGLELEAGPAGLAAAEAAKTAGAARVLVIERDVRPGGILQQCIHPGMGRCQSGFCGPQVLAILARELDIPETKVRKRGVAAYMLARIPDLTTRRPADLGRQQVVQSTSRQVARLNRRWASW